LKKKDGTPMLWGGTENLSLHFTFSTFSLNLIVIKKSITQNIIKKSKETGI